MTFVVGFKIKKIDMCVQAFACDTYRPLVWHLASIQFHIKASKTGRSFKRKIGSKVMHDWISWCVSVTCFTHCKLLFFKVLHLFILKCIIGMDQREVRRRDPLHATSVCIAASQLSIGNSSCRKASVSRWSVFKK